MDRTLEEPAATAQAVSDQTIDKRSLNLEIDLYQSNFIVSKAKENDAYAQNLYAALCNNTFQAQDVFEILGNRTVGFSWRYAGCIVANLRGTGDYTDWYCSGIQIYAESDGYHPNEITMQFVPEGMITDEIRTDLSQIGWYAVDNKIEN